MSEYNYWRRNIGRRTFLGGAAAATAGLAAVGLAGCGDDDDKPAGGGGGAGGAKSPAAGTSPAAQQIKKGGTVRYVDVDPNAWDIFANTQVTGWTLSSLVRDNLLNFKNGPDAEAWDTTIEPGVAAKWEQPDPLTYVFKIDPRVKFPDIAPVNGRQYTAEDVVYTFEDMISKRGKWSNGTFYRFIKEVVATDKETVKLTMTQPYAPQLTYLAAHQFQLKAKEFQGQDSKPESSVGTGMMIFESYQPGVAAKYKKNPTYWRGPINIDNFEFRPILDENTRLAEFNAGNVDQFITTYLNAERLENEKKGTIQEYWSSADYSWHQNVNIAPWKDQRLRQAISMMNDREQWLKAFHGGKGKLGDDALGGMPIPPQLKPFSLERKEMGADLAKLISFNLADAKKLVEAAGATGFAFDLYSPAYGGDWESKAQAWTAALKSIGLEPKLIMQDRGQFNTTNLLGAPGTAATFYAWLAPNDPEEFSIYWLSGQVRNDSKVNDPKIDDFINKQGTAVKKEERVAIYKDFQKYVMPLCYYSFGPMRRNTHIVSNKLKNFRPTWFYTYRNVEYVWKDA
jgi:peptide/nickel transport system substrate-binding protein